MTNEEDEPEIEPEPIPLGSDPSMSYSEYLASLPDEIREAIERATGQWTREEAERRWLEGNGATNPNLP
jgi:hypothetical protein